ncbi:hypothetical protein P153DRAFT_32359 [Dothidotthia symphoricarpi CBS 119687]|uniref:Uncharacterized protein n=1 Tax=Dothidotthia symphoricarpi CBS 119687 TaxID=1392245 RepID=A0A6A6ADS4_9PLEO|nr:uncharacterized protein P153DRAFT_32359 [Dothidotthia symphoricarpi CBS 119687]KAF2129104.1 hypothetical protein P153DRAFT_32359 [Dothidotthia symphoricarpi CBS 119687]
MHSPSNHQQERKRSQTTIIPTSNPKPTPRFHPSPPSQIPTTSASTTTTTTTTRSYRRPLPPPRPHAPTYPPTSLPNTKPHPPRSTHPCPLSGHTSTLTPYTAPHRCTPLPDHIYTETTSKMRHGMQGQAMLCYTMQTPAAHP